MIENRVFVALAVTTAMGFLGAVSAAAGTDRDRGGREPGSVVPCSLAGVNPVHHPEIFGSAGTALSFGFVKSRDGTWQVVPNCHR